MAIINGRRLNVPESGVYGSELINQAGAGAGRRAVVRRGGTQFETIEPGTHYNRTDLLDGRGNPVKVTTIPDRVKGASCGGVRPPISKQIITEQVFDIAEHYLKRGVDFDEHNADWMVSPNYRLPDSWSSMAQLSPLLIVFPTEYPQIPPVGFYLKGEIMKKQTLLEKITGKKKKATPKSKEMVPVDQNPRKKKALTRIAGKDNLLQLAISKDLDIEKLRELIALKREEEAYQAKKEFDIHFAEMQKEFEPIGKTEQGYEFKYAPLGFMIEKYGPIISKHGFSFRWREEKIENGKRVYIVISGWGHMDQNTYFDVPIVTPTKRQNEIQVKGTMSSYGERYTFKAGFGIIEIADDTDGNFEKKEFQMKDTFENKQLYRFAIVGILQNKLFSDEERQQFKDAVKNDEIKTLKQYIKNYNNSIKERDKRKAEKNKQKVNTSKEKKQPSDLFKAEIADKEAYTEMGVYREDK